MKKKPQRVEHLFCTACGEEIELFSFSKRAKDLEAIRKGADNCKKIGKTNGMHCAKLFIADNNAMSVYFRPRKRPASKQKVNALKKSIVRRIGRTAD